jgi:hypothetical protein
MRLEIVEAKPFHCGQMARMLRAEHENVLTKLGVRPHRALRASYDDAPFAKACFIDGRLACLWGVDGTLACDEAHVWMALARWMTPHARTVLTVCKQQVNELLKTRRRLRTLMLIEDKTSFRFAQHLGFRVAPHLESTFETVWMEIQRGF